MRVIRGIEKLEVENTVITIGNFDGVHKGHEKLFEFVKRKAKLINGTSVVVTFHPHPIKVLFKEHPLKLITTTEDKLKLIEKCGIDITVLIPFTPTFAQIEAEDFVRDILIQKFNAKWVIVGYDYKFGKGRRGDRDLLKTLGNSYGFKVKVLKAYKRKGKILSSTAVRNALKEGNVREANLFLGRAYHIDGEVIKGFGRGSSLLGYPTANILPFQEIIPKEGVYAVKIAIKHLSKIYRGVANIGRNPTFDNESLSYEVHILDFNEDLIGKSIRIHFIARIRDEKKFSSPEELKQSIAKDIEEAKKVFSRDKTKLFLNF